MNLKEEFEMQAVSDKHLKYLSTKASFTVGAIYGYRKAIELLRSEISKNGSSSRHWPDWLESQLDEPKENNR